MRWAIAFGLLAATSCRPKSERLEVEAPTIASEVPSAPARLVPAAVACPAVARCLGILDDLSAVLGFEADLPSLVGPREGLIRDEPGSAWLVVDDDERLVLIVELPVDDTRRFVRSFVEDEVEVEPLGDEAYRVGDFTVVDDGSMMLLSRAGEVLLEEIDAGRPEIPSEPDVIARVWVTRNAFPAWAFARFDELMATRYEAAERAGDQPMMTQLSLLTDMVVDTTDLEIALREEHDDWVVEAALYPAQDTWALRRAKANAAPRCPLGALVTAEDAPIVASICEQGWARPREEGMLPITPGPLGDIWRGFFDPGFVVEGVLWLQIPLSGFAAVRMPDPEAARTWLANVDIVIRSGAMDLPITVHPKQTKDGRAVYRVDVDDDGEPTPLALTLVDDVALLTFGPGAPERLDALAARVPKLAAAPTPRMRLRLNLGEATDLRGNAEIAHLIGRFDSALTLRAVDDHDVWSLRVHGRMLHTMATGDTDTDDDTDDDDDGADASVPTTEARAGPERRGRRARRARAGLRR